MSPLPGHQPIPPDWSAHHQPTAEATLNATCDLYSGAAGPAPYPQPADWTADGVPLATALPCRVQALVSAGAAMQAEQVQSTRRYLVAVPLHQVPALTVTDHGPIVQLHGGDDPQLAGIRLKVVDVQHGSYAWERDLVCVHNLTQD